MRQKIPAPQKAPICLLPIIPSQLQETTTLLISNMIDCICLFFNLIQTGSCKTCYFVSSFLLSNFSCKIYVVAWSYHLLFLHSIVFHGMNILKILNCYFFFFGHIGEELLVITVTASFHLLQPLLQLTFLYLSFGSNILITLVYISKNEIVRS